MKTHGFGIVGCGMIAEYHTRAILEIEGARVVAAYSRSSNGEKIADFESLEDYGKSNPMPEPAAEDPFAVSVSADAGAGDAQPDPFAQVGEPAASDSLASPDDREPQFRPALGKPEVRHLGVHLASDWVDGFDFPAVGKGVVQFVPGLGGTGTEPRGELLRIAVHVLVDRVSAGRVAFPKFLR